MTGKTRVSPLNITKISVGYEDHRNPVEAWNSYVSELHNLISLRGESPTAYKTMQKSGYGPATVNKKEMNDAQAEQWEKQTQKWDEESFRLSLEVDDQRFDYWANPDSIVNPGYSESEEEFLANLKTPPSSLRFKSEDGQNLRMRVLREYEPEVFHRVYDHDDIPLDNPAEEGERFRASEPRLYSAFWELESSGRFEDNQLSFLPHPEHVVIDTGVQEEFDYWDREVAILYPEDPTVDELEFSDEVIDELARTHATESVLQVKFPDQIWGERVFTGNSISNIDMEYPILNDRAEWREHMFQNKIYNNESKSSDWDRRRKDDWAERLAEKYQEIRDEATLDMMEFAEVYLEQEGVEPPEFRDKRTSIA